MNSTTKGNRPPYQTGRTSQDITNRKVLLGVCGGIAAYKAVELTRLLVKAGARVQVVMTDAAVKFVTPLTFETITGRHVFVDMFPPHGDFSPWHTEMASWPDIAVIAPATANHMARLAAGIADDLLSTIMLTLEKPRLLCPSMNHRMWANPATQDNLAVLKRRGFRFVLPTEGEMARPGEDPGIGRLAEPESIVRELTHVLSAPQDLRGVRVLVTAGRTEEAWDPVRVLTNRASGRMGFALAEEARERGADVVLIHGPTDVIPPVGVRIRKVTTAAEMATVVKQEFPQSRIVLMAAAVADYTFARTAEHKIKKGEPEPALHLVATEDILKGLAERKGERIVVGFALETENLLENALRKLRDKHLDIVVANNPLLPGSGFAGETNQVLMIHRSGRVNDLPLQSKREAARDILNAVIEIFRNPEPEPERDTAPVDEEAAVAPEIEDDFEMPASLMTPVAAGSAATPSSPTPPVGAGSQPPQGASRSSRRNKRRKGRHGQGQPIPGQVPLGAPQDGPSGPTADAAVHADTAPAPVSPETRPAQDEPKPAPVKPAVESKPVHSEIKPVLVVPKSAMIESRPSSVPSRSPRGPVRHSSLKPEPVRTEPPVAAVEPKAPVTTVEASETVAELPFPAVPGAAPAAKKSGKTRRGGRRSARARAARHGGDAAPAADGSPKPETTPMPAEPAPAPVVVPAPAATEAGEVKAKPVRKTTRATTERKKPAVKKPPKTAKAKPSDSEDA